MASPNLVSNNPRFYLWLALAALLLLNYQAWMKDYAPPPQAAGANTSASAPAAPATDLGSHIPSGPAAPAEPAAAGTAAGSGAPVAKGEVPGAAPVAAASPASGEAAAAAPTVRVRTDVLDVTIDTRGGTLERVDLLAYPQVKGEAAPVRLENDDSPASLYLLQSGLTGPEGAVYPTHLALWQSAQEDYTLEHGDELRVPLTWHEGGIEVTKTFVFRRGQYRIDVDFNVHNGSAAPWVGRPYAQIQRNDPPTKRSYFTYNVSSYAYHGPALYDGEKFRRINVGDAQESHLALDVKNGWVASLQHHFVSAIVPPTGVPWHFGVSVAGEQYLLSALGPEQTIAPGASGAFSTTVFTGPKLQSQLKATSPELGRVADYGRLWFLAQPLFVALSFVHRLTGNWGVAIILVTFLLKLVFYPLSEASGRSMAKMKTLQPRIKNLQETYADDREKLGKAMMELYQREKINPVAGCLPIIIQIPVFIAFYWVLLESVEMRQAPFAFWIRDLSSRDPWFILPAIMAVAMFVQYKLNPAPPDPVQAKVFMFMPIFMSVTFAFFPAGLVLYWVTNTVLSILQQWNINRRIEAAVAAKR
jgi:YidC/Oxa1 family membrane protein insertase